MSDTDAVFELAEGLILEATNASLSDLQRTILLTVLQGERKTYDQIAEDCGYSAKYVKQDVAPKLWHLLSEALGHKVSKLNARGLLEQELIKRTAANATDRPPSSPSASAHPSTPASANLSPSAVALSSIPALLAQDVGDTEPAQSSILLVDDQPKNLRLLSDLLEEQGYEVQQAINGPVALEAVTMSSPDLILMDINMPEMDGYTVCQKLKANPRTADIPVIFVSALDEAWDKVKGFSVGGVDYITKPFKVVEVLARVESQLNLQRLQRELKTQNLHLRQALQELTRLAAIDDLTLLASRQRFDEYLRASWQQASEKHTALTLVLCHIDQFKGDSVTDPAAPARQAIDTCLYQVAQIIRRAVQRSEDFVGRYGTTRFAIVCPNQRVAELEPIAQKLLDTVREMSVPQALNTDQMTLSIAIATATPQAADELSAFISACEAQLKQALEQGGDRFLVGSASS